MPELPEVQTIVNDLISAGLAGPRLSGVTIRWPGVIHGLRAGTFRRRVTGRRIRNITRRAKFIIWQLDDETRVLVHLRMTGQFFILEDYVPEQLEQAEMWLREWKKARKAESRTE